MEKVEKLAIHGGNPVRTERFPEWPIFGELEEQMLLNAVRAGKWGGTGGVKPGYTDYIAEFERQFAELQHARYALCCVNGTLAITIALQAAGVEPGDEVIMPPYTFIGTASAPLLYETIPVFADIDANTMMIDPDKVEPLITPRTKAIIAVHIAGAPANMTRLKEIAAKHNLVLVEDAAQAVGAQWDGVGVGAIGDIGTFSLQGSKNVNAGEGGVVVTNRKDLHDAAWSTINVGRTPDGQWYHHVLIGQNYRMTEFQAAIALAQMARLQEQMDRREANAQLLDRLLGDIEGIRVLQHDPRTTRHAHHGYIFCLVPELLRIDKSEFVRRMRAEGVPALAGYVPLNRNEAIIRETKKRTGEERVNECPVNERMCEKEALWFTQTMLLADEQAMHDIAGAIRKVIALD